MFIKFLITQNVIQYIYVHSNTLFLNSYFTFRDSSFWLWLLWLLPHRHLMPRATDMLRLPPTPQHQLMPQLLPTLHTRSQPMMLLQFMLITTLWMTTMVPSSALVRSEMVMPLPAPTQSLFLMAGSKLSTIR